MHAVIGVSRPWRHTALQNAGQFVLDQFQLAWRGREPMDIAADMMAIREDDDAIILAENLIEPTMHSLGLLEPFRDVHGRASSCPGSETRARAPCLTRNLRSKARSPNVSTAASH